jgi:hypothetical protein
MDIHFKKDWKINNDCQSKQSNEKESFPSAPEGERQRYKAYGNGTPVVEVAVFYLAEASKAARLVRYKLPFFNSLMA